MGNIATILERAEEKLDRSKAEAFAQKALTGDGFSLEDFRDQLHQIKKLGSMQSISEAVLPISTSQHGQSLMPFFVGHQLRAEASSEVG